MGIIEPRAQEKKRKTYRYHWYQAVLEFPDTTHRKTNNNTCKQARDLQIQPINQSIYQALHCTILHHAVAPRGPKGREKKQKNCQQKISGKNKKISRTLRRTYDIHMYV